MARHPSRADYQISSRLGVDDEDVRAAYEEARNAPDDSWHRVVAQPAAPVAVVVEPVVAPPAVNPWELAKRERKVRTLVNYFDKTVHDSGADPMDVRVAAAVVEKLLAASDEDWAQAATAAGCNAPGVDTREVVIAQYRARSLAHALGR